MLKRLTCLFSLFLALTSCNNIKNDSENRSIFISDSSLSKNNSQILDGYIVPYNNAFTRLNALEEDINGFIQYDTDNISFITLDDSKIDDLFDAKYVVNGYIHTERKQKFSLYKIETDITLLINETKEQIKFVSYGSKDASETSGLTISNNQNGFDIKENDLIIGEIITKLSNDFIQNLIDTALVRLTLDYINN